MEIAPREVLHHKEQVVTRLEAEEELHHKRVVRVDENIALRHDTLQVGATGKRLVLALRLHGIEVAGRLLTSKVHACSSHSREWHGVSGQQQQQGGKGRASTVASAFGHCAGGAYGRMRPWRSVE